MDRLIAEMIDLTEFEATASDGNALTAEVVDVNNYKGEWFDGD